MSNGTKQGVWLRQSAATCHEKSFHPDYSGPEYQAIPREEWWPKDAFVVGQRVYTKTSGRKFIIRSNPFRMGGMVEYIVDRVDGAKGLLFTHSSLTPTDPNAKPEPTEITLRGSPEWIARIRVLAHFTSDVEELSDD